MTAAIDLFTPTLDLTPRQSWSRSVYSLLGTAARLHPGVAHSTDGL